MYRKRKSRFEDESIALSILQLICSKRILKKDIFEKIVWSIKKTCIISNNIGTSCNHVHRKDLLKVDMIFKKDQGNISFLNKIKVKFSNSKWPLTDVAILGLKVVGHFEFTKSAKTLSRKKILNLFKS